MSLETASVIVQASKNPSPSQRGQRVGCRASFMSTCRGFAVSTSIQTGTSEAAKKSNSSECETDQSIPPCGDGRPFSDFAYENPAIPHPSENNAETAVSEEIGETEGTSLSRVFTNRDYTSSFNFL